MADATKYATGKELQLVWMADEFTPRDLDGEYVTRDIADMGYTQYIIDGILADPATVVVRDSP